MKFRLVKIKMIMKRLIIILIAVFSISTVLRAEIPERPNPPRLVNDFANILNGNEKASLEKDLVQFARETSTQIVVVTVPDLEGYDKADYAVRLAENWGVGQKGKDNGIVILLKPKKGRSRGEVFIATGYGLEGVLPDAIVNGVIIDNEMIPRFKQEDYFGGLVSGIKVMKEIARGEYTADAYRESVKGGAGSVVPFIVFMLIFIFSIFGRNRRGRYYSPGRSLPFWMAMGMMSGGRSGGGGSFNNFSSGGGGFGGFGGGSFGGGGAGGSW
jgi:uncharacterized protein